MLDFCSGVPSTHANKSKVWIAEQDPLAYWLLLAGVKAKKKLTYVDWNCDGTPMYFQILYDLGKYDSPPLIHILCSFMACFIPVVQKMLKREISKAACAYL